MPSPSSSSITMYGVPSSAWPMSYTSTIAGCLSWPHARASWKKRCVARLLDASRWSRNLIAKSRSVSSLRAAHTDPIAPEPSCLVRRYLPEMRSPGFTGAERAGGQRR